METNWAVENLQAIRTLMERSALYRRALAPIMTFTGLVGIIAGVVGWYWGLGSVRGFAIYWMAVSLLAIAGDYLLVRRQALRESEPFWSPPTRRVTLAILPCLFAGLVTGVVFIGWVDDNIKATVLLPVIWMILYGCALHAAGFFMPRGIKLFAWALIVGGCALLLALSSLEIPSPLCGHVVMGIFFGGCQLAYGIYLYFTEPRKNET
ncbi:MAG TPA: hypothetical protein VH598_07940 [Verrucomicrobiae bacterium]|nr:hypothetical protein [Verrucomicrobiae bacterium]